MAKKDAAAEYLKSVLEKVPAEKKALVEQILGEDTVLEAIGEGVLRQSDYSREMNRLKEVEASQTDWWTKHNGILKAGTSAMGKLKALKETGIDPDDPQSWRLRTQMDDDDDRPGSKVDLSGLVKREDFDAALNERLAAEGQQFLVLTAIMPKMVAEHLREFNEVLDPLPLIQEAQKTGRNIIDTYNLAVQGKRAEKQSKDFEEKLKKAREEGAEAERTRLSTLPYDSPDAGGSELSPFMKGMTTKPEEKLKDPLRQAAMEWNKELRRAPA